MWSCSSLSNSAPAYQMSLSSEFTQLLLPKLLVSSPCRKPCIRASFSYSPSDSKFQVTSLYKLHLRPPVIKGVVKWIVIPYHASLALIVTLIHICMNLIPREFSPTCSNAPQGSFSSTCTTTHLLSWKQEDKHRTSPANHYSI